MPHEAAYRVAVLCEDQQHFDLVRTLTRRIVEREVPFTDGQVDTFLAWQTTTADAWIRWSSGEQPAENEVVVGGRRIRMHGSLGPRPLPDVGAWRRTLVPIAQQQPPPHVVILARDLDGHPDRAEAIRVVAEELPWPWRTVAATFQPEAEAWLVAGFEPRDAADQRRLDAARQRLGFDPRIASAHLTSGKPHDPKDAKRLLTEMVGAGRFDELTEDLERLLSRGGANGCAAFAQEVRSRIVSLVRGDG